MTITRNRSNVAARRLRAIAGNARNNNRDAAMNHGHETTIVVISARRPGRKRRPSNKIENSSSRKRMTKTLRTPSRSRNKGKMRKAMKRRAISHRRVVGVVAAGVGDVVAVAIRLNKRTRIKSRMLMRRPQSKSHRTASQ